MRYKTLREMTRQHLEMVLEKTSWDLEKAARLLQVPTARIRQFIVALGIEEPADVQGPLHNPSSQKKEVDDETEPS